MRLPPEVMLRTLEQLHRPLPPPGGRAERSTLRQADIATAMRVSKIFHNLASGILYRTAATDDLGRFVYGADPIGNAIDDIRSKSELLAGVRHLFLEHDPKEAPSYADLLAVGGDKWTIVDLDQDYHPASYLRLLYKQEAQAVSDGLSTLVRIHEIRRARLSGRLASGPTGKETPGVDLEREGLGLQSIAMCALLGDQDERWLATVGHDRGHAGMEDIVDLVRQARASLVRLTTSPDILLRTVCYRAKAGPYSPMRSGPGPECLTVVAHIDKFWECAPAVCGWRGGADVRWYVQPSFFLDAWDMSAEQATRTMDNHEVMQECTHLLVRAYRFRDWMSRVSLRSGHKPATWHPMRLSVYVAPPVVIKEEGIEDAETDVIDFLEKEAKPGKPESSVARDLRELFDPLAAYCWEKDVCSWARMREAPPCDACGWSATA